MFTLDSIGSTLKIVAKYKGHSCKFESYDTSMLGDNGVIVFGYISNFTKFKKAYYKKHNLLNCSQEQYDKLLNQFPYLKTSGHYCMETCSDIFYSLYTNDQAENKYWNAMIYYPYYNLNDN